jgi:peroxiredoxin
MSLQNKLETLKVELETKLLPASAVEALHRSVDELAASGISERALKAGDVAPAFTLPDAEGTLHDSNQLLARGPLVVTFYRGVWCPYCNVDLQALEAVRAEIESRGASIVAVSQQSASNSRKSERTNALAFPILSDKGGELAARFGLRWELPEYLRVVHRQLGADLTVFNGEDSWTLPMPARYIIGQDRVIAYAEVNADYTRRPEPTDLYPVLEQLRRAHAA